jgi:hypothetical protein
MTTAARRGPVVAAARLSPSPIAVPAPVVPAERPSTMRIICWQLAGVLGLAAYERPWPAAVALGTAGTVLLAGSAARSRGVWLSTRAQRRIRRWCRRPATVTDAAGLLRALVPGARLTTTEIDGEAAGTVSRPDGLVVAVRTDLGDVPSGPQWTVRELVRPRQARLVVLQAHRDADSPGDETLAVVLGNAIRRMRRTGGSVTLLGHRELATAIWPHAPGPVRIAERRHEWRAGATVHIGLEVTG